MPRPAGGYKNAAGQPIPGCTTVVGRWKESGGLIRWAWKEGKEGRELYEKRDEAADIGTYMHDLVYADLLETAPAACPAQFTQAQKKAAAHGFESYLEWKDGVGIKLEEAEISMVNERLQCGGTLDAIIRYGKAQKLGIYDWKSGKDFYMDQLIQLVFYMDTYNELFLSGIDPEMGPMPQIEGIHIVRFGKTGADFSHHFFRADHPKVALARRQFELFREAYTIDKALAE